MEFREKIQLLRKENKLSQEGVAEKLAVSRQAVAKWELGQSYPDIKNLIGLSDLFKVSLDSMLRNNDGTCAKDSRVIEEGDIIETIAFLCQAKKNTYAAKKQEENCPSRPAAHDLHFENGKYKYIDTFLGGEKFSGEEAVWFENQPIWTMNYCGRVLNESFSGDFLKQALLLVSEEYPYRGPLMYQKGDYVYHCSVEGSFHWYQGKEEMFCKDEKVYECFFHGGLIK